MTADALEWPSSPYKGLNYYSAADLPLFGERDQDTRDCAELLALCETKVLLVQGRTGTGKSSFLRAGVLPFLTCQETGFCFLKSIQSPGEPLLVRCTDDPAMRLAEAIKAALENPVDFQGLDPKQSRELVDLLPIVRAPNRATLVDNLYKVLKKITSCISGTLILTIDQAEEVLTISSDPKDLEKKKSFFDLAERFCVEPIDVKFILCLRTEYYGQFAEWFKVDPTSRLSTQSYGLMQFMLHGFKDQQSLVKAIVRPTLKQEVKQFGLTLDPPFDHYRFEYAERLPETIAADVFKHCGESGTLPVMQIVCNDLYNYVVKSEKQKDKEKQKDRYVISFTAYKLRGGVEGAMDRYIDDSIKGVLTKTKAGTSKEDVGKWRDVIAALVVRQEGGTLTTTLMPLTELESHAEKAGLRANVRDCLELMADERLRLVRTVHMAVPGEDQPYYSLGHDALAASLFQWKDMRAKLYSERTRLRRLQSVFAMACIVLIGFSGFLIWQHFRLKQLAYEMLIQTVDHEPTSSARKRLLLLAFGIANSKGLDRYFIPKVKDLPDKLRDVLKRSPKVMATATAAGLNADKSKVALFELEKDGKNGKVSILNLKTGKSGIVEDLLASPKAEERNQYGSSIGFVHGLDTPVVSQSGIIYYNAGSKWMDVSLSDVLHHEEAQPFRVDITGGVARINYFEIHRIHQVDIEYHDEDGKFYQKIEVNTYYKPSLSPVESDESDRYVFLSLPPNPIVEVGSRTGDEQIEEAGTLEDVDEESKALEQIRALGFANHDAAIVVREAKADFKLFFGPPYPREKPLVIRVPDDPELRSAPVRHPWRLTRPLLAATMLEKDKEWRIAWIGPRGITGLRAREAPLNPHRIMAEERLLPDLPLLSSTPQIEAATKLAFSDNGESLTVVTQREREVVDVRSWDLSEERRRKIRSMSEEDLLAEACQISAQEADGSRLDDGEIAPWQRPLGDRQPCEGH